jgi:hypothetical protein
MPLRFAMVTDTHVGMTPASAERLRRVYAAVARRAPDVVSADGRLVRVGLASGHEQGSMQYTLARCYSAPGVVGDTLVAGDQDGVVHGIRLPADPGSCG